MRRVEKMDDNRGKGERSFATATVMLEECEDG